MLYTKIKADEIGIVFKNGAVSTVLNPGLCLKPMGKLILFKTTQAFVAPCNWVILEQHKALMDKLTVIDVADNELVVEFINERYSKVLAPGRYAYWKNVLPLTFERYATDELFVSKQLSKHIAQDLIIKGYIRFVEVLASEKALLYVNDDLHATLDSGRYYFWVNANDVKLQRIDMRHQLLEISGQELLTKDKAAVRVNFQLSYKVEEVKKALVEHKDYEKQLYALMQMALREYIGSYELDELIASKEKVSHRVQKATQELAKNLGVSIINSGIRDIILPGEVKEIMNQVLVAQKKAQANTITRRDETASTRSLLNTAKLMSDNEMLFRLKEMEYVEKIAEKIGEISLSGSDGMLKQLKQIFEARA